MDLYNSDRNGFQNSDSDAVGILPVRRQKCLEKLDVVLD